MNDKRIYCLRQANREFFGDSPAAVRQEGYLEEVDGLTPEQLTAAYREMLRTASMSSSCWAATMPRRRPSGMRCWPS